MEAVKRHETCGSEAMIFVTLRTARSMSLVGLHWLPVSSKSHGEHASPWMDLGECCVHMPVGSYHTEPGGFSTFIASRSKPALYLGRDVTSSQGCSPP